MALEIFYSALHWAKKAERSATSAANSSQIARTAAAQASQASGKIIQLGFDGAIEDGKLVFKHAPSGVEVPYELLDDYEYELDLSYNSLEDLSGDVQMYVKNGYDTITFVSALHRDSTSYVTVGDMKAVMRYNADTGYRWLFKAAFKIAPNGTKVFLLYPVVASEEAVNSKITNCITEIPQDIKLELSDGTLTLKAGSKVYVPNGFEADGVTPKFDEVVIDSDISIQGSFSSQYVVVYNTNIPTDMARVAPTSCFSGSTAPSGQQYMLWYDTTNNTVKTTSDSGASWIAGYSLPYAIVTESTTGFTSIDQVFNGFGYIGSTVFALPGVKGLIPNGRNADGSLRNSEARTDSVITYTNTDSQNKRYSFVSPVNGIWTEINYKTDSALSVGTQSISWFFDENANYWMYYGNKSYNWVDFAHSANNTTSPFAITSFTPKLPFHAVDYSDSSWVSAQAMPSVRFIDLTLGASGSTYTAPANGYFYFRRSLQANKNITIFNVTKGNIFVRAAASFGISDTCLMPACKGDIVSVGYDSTAGTGDEFKFIYAEGE